jgi:phosphatidylserine decarboxylase
MGIGLGRSPLAKRGVWDLRVGSVLAVMPYSVPSFIAAQVIRLLPRQFIGRVVGDLCERPLPASVSNAVVGAWCRAYNVDLSDIAPHPEPWTSVDEFFTRPLVPGARRTEAPTDDVVSPADGAVQSMGRVERGARIVVKKKAYDVARLIADEDDARSYVGGQYAVVYLSPRDYHRVHAPVDGPVVTVRSLHGDYYPVNAIGERWVRDLFVTNRRVVIVQDSQTLGRITVVMVAAMVVGRITVTMVSGRDVPAGIHHLSPAHAMRRGDELGAFHLGSTAVVLAGPQAAAWQRAPGLIRVGQSLTRTG